MIDQVPFIQIIALIFQSHIMLLVIWQKLSFSHPMYPPHLPLPPPTPNENEKSFELHWAEWKSHQNLPKSNWKAKWEYLFLSVSIKENFHIFCSVRHYCLSTRFFRSLRVWPKTTSPGRPDMESTCLDMIRMCPKSRTIRTFFETNYQIRIMLCAINW